MFEFWNTVIGLPIANLCIVGGIIFLFIAVVGRFRNYFDVGKWGRILSGIFGGLLLSIGLGIYSAGTLTTKLSHLFNR